jgi:hypothetical protein
MANVSVTPSLRRSAHLITLFAAGLLAPAAGGQEVARSKPWATVNVCDTAAHPNTIGIRASMPGTGSRAERMFMRFQVQYYRARDDTWHPVGRAADSGFVLLGSGRARARQAGRNFVLEQPPRGRSHVVRGFVTFEWRRGAEVEQRTVRITRAGRPKTVGADPPDFSAATCEIR